MGSPQPGIFALGTNSHAYLELDLAPGAQPLDAVTLVASLREPRTTIGGVNLVAGFRPELWAAIAPDAAPAGVAGFDEPVRGPDGYELPATQHDIVVWLTGASYDVVFDLSAGVLLALAGHATLANEIVGWPYHHDRDLTGFIDGTENPSLVDAMTVAVIPAGEAGDGGSILLLQQWQHDAVALGGAAGPGAGERPGPAEGRQRRARPAAADVARRPDRPGHVRPDLPAEHRLRLR